jgi:hypothetical protein
LARHSAVTVHSIYLKPAPARCGPLTSLRRRLSEGAEWLLRPVLRDENRAMARETRNLLRSVSAATGGQACAVSDEGRSRTCARAIAAEITRTATALPAGWR